jgi:hypothetical protein
MGKVGGGRKQWVFCFCADVLFRVLFNRPELLLIRLPLPRALGGRHARAQGGGQLSALHNKGELCVTYVFVIVVFAMSFDNVNNTN